MPAIHPRLFQSFQSLKLSSWNICYLPYCVRRVKCCICLLFPPTHSETCAPSTHLLAIQQSRERCCFYDNWVLQDKLQRGFSFQRGFQGEGTCLAWNPVLWNPFTCFWSHSKVEKMNISHLLNAPEGWRFVNTLLVLNVSEVKHSQSCENGHIVYFIQTCIKSPDTCIILYNVQYHPCWLISQCLTFLN